MEVSALRDRLRRECVEPSGDLGAAQASAAVKQEIQHIRAGRAPAVIKDREVIDLVTATLRKRGPFFHDGALAYAFLSDTTKLIRLADAEQALELVLHDFGLHPREQLTRNVVDALRLEALARGQRTAVHPFAFYDRHQHTAYVSDFAGQMFLLGPGGVCVRPNGHDGVLMVTDSRWQALDLHASAIANAQTAWRDWLFDGIRFNEAALTADDQKALFLLWVLTIFFPQLFPTRVILTMIGEKGSGKTSILRRLGQLLFGPRFNVSALTSKSDDFDAAITNQAFVVADNADDAPGWLQDRLAVVATGGSIKRRVLYTTNAETEFTITATLAITSRTPNFRRDDVAERLLPLNVERMAQFQPENALLAAVQDQRNELMAGVLHDVWKAAEALKASSGTIHRTTFRMADFADFALKVAPVVGFRGSAGDLLKRLGEQQISFASDDEPLPKFIDEWLAHDDPEEGVVNPDREISLSDLREELETMVKGAVPWDRGNSRSFGQYFRSKKGLLASLFELTERHGHAGASIVRFRRRSG